MGLLQAGSYSRLRINGSALKDGKTEGEPVIMIYLEDPESGDTITDYLYTSNAAWDKVTAPRLKAYGWDPAENSYAIAQLNRSNEENNPLLGKYVEDVVIKEETFEGKTRPKVAGVGAFVREQMDPTQAKQFEVSLRARLIGNGAKVKAPVAKPRTPTPLVATKEFVPTDEIPY